MKLIMDKGLKCRCGSETIYLDDIALQQDYYGYSAPFVLYIYFKCSFCGDRFRFHQKRDQKRLTIKQQYINRAVWIKFVPQRDIVGLQSARAQRAFFKPHP